MHLAEILTSRDVEKYRHHIASTKREKHDKSGIFVLLSCIDQFSGKHGKTQFAVLGRTFLKSFSTRGCEVLTLTWRPALKSSSTCSNKQCMLMGAPVQTNYKYYPQVTDCSFVHLLKQA